jgi:hypothetical protein
MSGALPNNNLALKSNLRFGEVVVLPKWLHSEV